MSETLTKLDNLSKTVRTSARNVLRGRSRRRAASGSKTKKFCENKPVPVVKHVEIQQFFFAKVSK